MDGDHPLPFGEAGLFIFNPNKIKLAYAGHMCSGPCFLFLTLIGEAAATYTYRSMLAL